MASPSTNRTSAGFLKIRPVRPGARIAIVAPSSPLSRESAAEAVLEKGAAELRRLGFDPVYDERTVASTGYTAGDAALRASALADALRDPRVDAIVALRGGYGSVHVLPLLEPREWAVRRTAFVGYSDATSLHVFLNGRAGLVSVHGPMVDRRLSGGPEAYEPSTFLTSLLDHPVGEVPAPALTALIDGPEVAGPLFGGTLSLLTASLGTPFAFAPPEGHVLYLDEVGERPYRIDRMLTQLKYAGVLSRASAIVCNGFRDCAEPGGEPRATDVIRGVLSGFHGPVLFGLTSGHDTGETVTLPFGVRARVVSSPRPRLIIEEAAAGD
jgi:muramoyltetrapeptide carboxypeptidase